MAGAEEEGEDAVRFLSVVAPNLGETEYHESKMVENQSVSMLVC